jgi:outer membrane biosynthesis protein TonB
MEIPRSFVYSLILHLGLIVLIFFGLPNVYDKKLPPEASISIDLVPIKKKSNIANHKKEKLSDNKIDEAKIIVKATNDAVKDKSSPPEEKPNKDVENQQKDNTMFKKDAPKAIKKEPKSLPPEKKIEKKAEKKAKKSAEKTSPSSNFDSNALMKSLDDNADKITAKATKNKTSNQLQTSENNSKGQLFDPLKDLSLSEQDNIRRQIEDAWHYPAGAKDTDKMTVLLSITIESDGTISNIKHIGGNDADNPAVYLVVVDSTIRAAKKASPLSNLDVERFKYWHVINMNFNVSEMMNASQDLE